jgi:transposase
LILYAICVMEHVTKNDLAQIDRSYLQSLENEVLIDVACRLRDFCAELMERLEQNSSNSSKPPSSDDPYRKGKKGKRDSEDGDAGSSRAEDKEDKTTGKDASSESSKADDCKRSAGRQPGSQGFWRTETPVPESTVRHYPDHCVICGKELACVAEVSGPWMGHYVYELEKRESGIRVFCTLHHYYGAICDCGHETKAQPGEGRISHVEGRKKDLKLSEYTMVGPMLATFIAALSVRLRMSRAKIREFLSYWLNTEFSVGTIDKCIREAGVACYEVVEELVKELQAEEIANLDETPWYEKGRLKWLWVAISKSVAVFYIGTRKKEELLNLITEAFIGWLVTDGYLAYRSYEKRQRCLAHLIRKAIALSGAVDKRAQEMGEWFLRELRGLITAMAEHGEGGKRKCSPILARLKRACNLGSEENHSKLRALAKEILNDWDAVVAFVKNPGLPPTNNDAERALRHAVISRRISFGTRTTEGSMAYAALLSVIETCRLRNQDPWQYIAQTIALGRKGIAPSPIPA